ncbi:hypothetical protein IFM89_002182 [Coptis chinensis]|uniref:ATP-dependent RNA helicase n=1 Tax=Coptis chinensis TaxID=261450 RepID=A0A835I7C3_9MAGN|nr:hypothetical protein IFM89_002182 [Coptis chinensis]
MAYLSESLAICERAKCEPVLYNRVEELLKGKFMAVLIAIKISLGGIGTRRITIDARRYDSRMNELLSSDGQDIESYDVVHETFNAMGLHENLLRGIYAYGFEKPSAIQQRGIVPFCKGLDVIQQAQSGTGKTATFCSGILQQLVYRSVYCQALVLASTRVLAQQIERVMRALGDYLEVRVHACVGGTSVREDQRILSDGVHVVVGTPGRVFELLWRRSLPANDIKMFVLDEADEMLSRVMAGLEPEGSQFDAQRYDSRMNELLSLDGQDIESYDVVHETFDAMGLHENLLRGIYACETVKACEATREELCPSEGLDVIQQAQSGTGKTATFCSVRVHACVGGTSVREDQRILSDGVHVVVETPGRVFDMLRRHSLPANDIKMFVLDGADEMLSRGNLPIDVLLDVLSKVPIKSLSRFRWVCKSWCTAIPHPRFAKMHYLVTLHKRSPSLLILSSCVEIDFRLVDHLVFENHQFTLTDCRVRLTGFNQYSSKNCECISGLC